MAAAVQSLLEKLEPMAMMEEGGLKKAMLAASLLCEKARQDPETPSNIASVNGVFILLQTALLHPEPKLRTDATTVLGLCVESKDKSFLESAMEKNLVIALVRLCAEQDRRAKPGEADAANTSPGGEPPKAVDPDLPARKTAVVCLQHLLLNVDPAYSAQALAEPTLAGTPFALLANSDEQIRKHAAQMLQALLVPDASSSPERKLDTSPMVTFAKDQASKVAKAVAMGLSYEDPEVSDAAVKVLRALRPSCPALCDELKELEMSAAFAKLEGASDLVEWLS